MIKSYSRDKRSPEPKNKGVSRAMSSNKAKNTNPEILLRKSLFNHGLKGYRLHPKNLPGKPDLVYHKKKLAIFVNGCFWHRCPYCNLNNPVHNAEFWKAKFDGNKRRDMKKQQELRELGWRSFVAWECQIKKNLTYIVTAIKPLLKDESE